MITNERTNFITDHTFNLLFNYNINADLNLDGVIGVNLRRDVFDRTTTSSTQQFVYGLATHNNFINHVNTTFFREENLIGAYATASLGYKSYLYFNVQARNDWTSTLESNNNSILYPSASVSFVATEAIESLRQSNMVNYLKFRIGYGTSAGYPNPYQTRNILGTATRAFISNGGAIINTNTVDNRFGNPDLKPETHREIELGVEGRFFNNRFGIDLSLYQKNSDDLIIDLDLDPSTGYSNTTINAASIENQGVELGIDVTPIQTNDFALTINANWTANEGIVTKLADGVDQIPFAGYTNLGNFAIPDQPYGIILGERVLRDGPDGLTGQPIVTGNGLYQAAPDIGVLGDPNPNYTLNGGITVTYIGLSFNALLTYVNGGVIYSTLPSTLMARGILQETDFDRFVPVVAPGVKADGTPNDVQITANQHYWRNGGVFNDEWRVYDGTYVKLREVSLSYALPSTLLENSPFGSVSFTLSGQNIWFDAFGFPDGANFDPEVLSLGVGNGRGFELMNVPTARQYGASVRVTF